VEAIRPVYAAYPHAPNKSRLQWLIADAVYPAAARALRGGPIPFPLPFVMSLFRFAAWVAATCASAAFFAPAFAASKPGANSIQSAELLAHTRVLASDAFEGRGPGTPGEEKTVRYLTEQFRGFGLQPGMPDGSWTQDVPILGVKSEVQFTLGGEALVFPQDYVGWSPEPGTTATVPATDLVFVGYGISAPEYGWDDFKGVDVRGKTVVILINDPPIPDPTDATKLDATQFGGPAMTYYGRWTYKFEEAGRRGAAAALIIHETKPAAYPWFVVVNSWGRERFDLESDHAPKSKVAGWLSLERAQKLFAANGTTYEAMKVAALKRDFRPVPLKEKAAFTAQNRSRSVKSKNVLAKLTGREAKLRDEWVVITAHWDHLGRNSELAGDQIFNGAADNAIGTAGLLELAEAFARAPRAPKRSVLFLSVTAEEQGLLGAAHYVAQPPYPLAKTVANLNMDGANQWGRTRDIRQIGRGASTLDAILDAAAKSQKRAVLPDAHPERGMFYRSDHFEFMKGGVPALYLKSGDEYLGKPAGYGESKVNQYIDRDYHKVSDEVKPDWDLSGAVEDLRLIHDLAWRIAEQRRPPQWKPGSEFKAVRDAQLK
jgi:Zn-dependent M28 family amino/carboxypeptidase